jgi:hypothetical protein
MLNIYRLYRKIGRIILTGTFADKPIVYLDLFQLEYYG